MKDRVDKKSAANAGDGNSNALPGSTQPFESQSIKQRRITERKLIDSNALSYLMSPTSNEPPKVIDELNDDNLKLIQRLQEEKRIRKEREDKRRKHELAKFVQETEEKQKVD